MSCTVLPLQMLSPPSQAFTSVRAVSPVTSAPHMSASSGPVDTGWLAFARDGKVAGFYSVIDSVALMCVLWQGKTLTPLSWWLLLVVFFFFTWSPTCVAAPSCTLRDPHPHSPTTDRYLRGRGQSFTTDHRWIYFFSSHHFLIQTIELCSLFQTPLSPE